MQMAFELAINILENGILLDFINHYFGFRFGSPRRYICCGAAFTLLFLQITLLNYFVPFNNIGTFVAMLLLWLYAVICLNGNTKIKLFIAVLLMTTVMLIASGTNLLISTALGNSARDMIVHFGPIRIVAVLLTKIILFYLTRIFLKFKEPHKLEWADLLPLTLTPSLSILSITIMMRSALQNEEIQRIVLHAVLCIFAVNLVTYYLFIRLGNESRRKLDLALMKQQNDYMQQKMDEVAAMYEETRALRHDIKNHLLSIDALLQTKEIDRVEQYITDLFHTQLEPHHQMVKTGNPLLDAVLGLKLSLCRQKHIDVVLNIQDSLLWMEPPDLSSLLGNVLDNAIEACSNMEEARMQLTIVPQGDYISISIGNSIPQSILQENPALLTTKQNKQQHGFGIRNIKRIVHKYQGLMDYYEDDRTLFCDMILQPTNTNITNYKTEIST